MNEIQYIQGSIFLRQRTYVVAEALSKNDNIFSTWFRARFRNFALIESIKSRGKPWPQNAASREELYLDATLSRIKLGIDSIKKLCYSFIVTRHN